MWWYGLETPVPVSSFASASYEFYRDGASTNPGIQAPAYALWLDLDCDANTGADQTYLIYEPGYQTPAPTPVPTLGEWSLLLTGLLLAALGSRQAAGRRRTRNGG